MPEAMAVSGRMAVLAVAAALMASGCGTRASPQSGAGLDAPAVEGGVEAAAPTVPRSGAAAEPAEPLPVHWPLSWEAVRALPSCGTNAPVRIHRPMYPVPLDLSLSADVPRAAAHYAAFIGINPTWSERWPWTRLDLAPDGSAVRGVIDCVVHCAGTYNPLGENLYYVAAGFDPAGEPICAWTNGGVPFRIELHNLAEPVEAVVTRGSPGPCDPVNARGALVEAPADRDDGILVRGVVRCTECESPYVRVRVLRASDGNTLYRVDAVVDREFTARVEPGAALSFEATEVLGTRTGRVDGVVVREGMDPIEIRIARDRDDSEPK